MLCTYEATAAYKLLNCNKTARISIQIPQVWHLQRGPPVRDQRRRRRSWRQRKGGGGSRLQFCGLGPFVAEQALPRAEVEGKERMKERRKGREPSLSS